MKFFSDITTTVTGTVCFTSVMLVGKLILAIGSAPNRQLVPSIEIFYYMFLRVRELSINCIVPILLINACLRSYKKRNVAELLRLYHGQGLIEQAADLGKDLPALA